MTNGASSYGSVTMASSEDASACIKNFNRTLWRGSLITVERAKVESSSGSESKAGRSSRDLETEKKERSRPSTSSTNTSHHHGGGHRAPGRDDKGRQGGGVLTFNQRKRELEEERRRRERERRKVEEDKGRRLESSRRQREEEQRQHKVKEDSRHSSKRPAEDQKSYYKDQKRAHGRRRDDYSSRSSRDAPGHSGSQKASSGSYRSGGGGGGGSGYSGRHLESRGGHERNYDSRSRSSRWDHRRDRGGGGGGGRQEGSGGGGHGSGHARSSTSHSSAASKLSGGGGYSGFGSGGDCGNALVDWGHGGRSTYDNKKVEGESKEKEERLVPGWGEPFCRSTPAPSSVNQLKGSHKPSLAQSLGADSMGRENTEHLNMVLVGGARSLGASPRGLAWSLPPHGLHMPDNQRDQRRYFQSSQMKVRLIRITFQFILDGWWFLWTIICVEQ